MSTVTITSSTAVERAVRFHDECVLIPEPQPRSRLPRLITKSYSLPLWKRRGGEGSETELTSPVDSDYIAFKLSVPSFTTKSLSPARDEFVPQSCLVHQNSPPSESSSPPHSRILRRSATLPIPHPDLVTVPLRPCCADCETIWEESMKEGDEWKEKFTRGARRRRNSSSDAPRARLHNDRHHASKTGVGSSRFDSVFSIQVDEVDKKRRNSEEVRTKAEDVICCDDDPEVAEMVSSTASLGVSIQEEDEDQLFPLPSPKRSPSGSPVPSPTASSSSLTLSGVKDSPRNCAAEAAKMTVSKPDRLFSPTRTKSWSPPSPLLSQSAPVPGRKISPSVVPSDLDFLEADRLLSSPAISRASLSSTSQTFSKKSSKSSIFVKAGSGILRSVNGLGSPPLI